MICRLNDHTIKCLVTQHYKKYHKDTKWHTDMNDTLEQITTILILTLLVVQSRSLWWDVFIFFYHKIKNNTWHKISITYIYKYDIAISKHTSKYQKIQYKNEKLTLAAFLINNSSSAISLIITLLIYSYMCAPKKN